MVHDSFYYSPLFNPAKVIPAYEGPPKQKNELGSLHYGSEETLALHIAEIDGKKVIDILEAAGFNSEKDRYSGFYLLPGEHTIKVVGSSYRTPWVRQTRMSAYASGTWWLKFTVEPGHKYLIDYKVLKKIKGTSKSAISVVVKDSASKKIVSEKTEEKE